MPQKPTLSIFTGTENMGLIYNEQVQINVKFWEFNFPLTDSEGHVAFNGGGKTKLIMLQAAMAGDGFSGASDDAKINNFVTIMNSWVDNSGAQSSKTYVDSLGNSYNVYSIDFMWTRAVNDPFRIIYTLMMKVAA